MAIAVSGIRVELREVVLRDKPPELIAASAKATVPVLVLPNGDVIDESLDIMRWALWQNDPEGWLAASDDTLIEANDGPYKQVLDRYKYPHRYDLADGLEHRQAGLEHLQLLDKRVSSSTYLGGDQLGFTDIALFPFVRQFAAVDNDWFNAQPLPALRNWFHQREESDLFVSIMHRYSQWHAGDPPTRFP